MGLIQSMMKIDRQTRFDRSFGKLVTNLNVAA